MNIAILDYVKWVFYIDTIIYQNHGESFQVIQLKLNLVYRTYTLKVYVKNWTGIDITSQTSSFSPINARTINMKSDHQSKYNKFQQQNPQSRAVM